MNKCHLSVLLKLTLVTLYFLLHPLSLCLSHQSIGLHCCPFPPNHHYSLCSNPCKLLSLLDLLFLHFIYFYLHFLKLSFHCLSYFISFVSFEFSMCIMCWCMMNGKITLNKAEITYDFQVMN